MSGQDPRNLAEKMDGLEQNVAKISDQLQVITDHQKSVIESLKKKKKIAFDYEEDENKERGNWTGKLDFLLSCLGYAVGLGNVWRFPYLCYKNGGGVFFVPYLIMLFFVGIPLFALELGIGQFSSRGPTRCWGLAPIFTGLGYGMLFVSALIALYYNVIIAWALWYFFASWASPLPWESCGSWSTELCEFNLKIDDRASCLRAGYIDGNAVCRQNDTHKLLGIVNATEAKVLNIQKVSAAEEYLSYKSLQDKKSDGLEDLGPIRWDMALSLLLAWIMVFFCMIKGIKSTGRVVYFTALFPYVVLIILFIRGLLLEGHGEGIEFYIKPKIERLNDALVWKDAAAQIFFSLGTSFGGLIALASYNRFKTDCIRDAIVVAIGNCSTSVFAGFAIFSFLGHLAFKLNKSVDDVVKSGVGLAFIVYPQAVTFLPGSTFWALLFFVMLITLGLDSEFTFMETVITGLCDRFPNHLIKRKTYVILAICIVLFLLGLTMATPGGAHMLTIMDSYAGGWNVMLLGLMECICVGYVYGVRRFLNDIETMTGKVIMGFIPWVIIKWYFAACWCVFSPLLLLFIMIFSWVKYKPIGYNDIEMSQGANALGWLMTVSVLVITVVVSLATVLTQKASSLSEKFKMSLKPTKYWGPAMVQFRQLVTYVPGFVLDPWSEDGIDEGFENIGYNTDKAERF